MYKLFLESNINNVEKAVDNNDADSSLDEYVKPLFSECGGCSFQNGLYRVHIPKSSIHWSLLIKSYYPQYKGKVIPFAFDWMGRQFAIDHLRKEIVLVFDPATLEYFEIEQNLISFHNQLLVTDGDELLSKTFFNEVMTLLKADKIKYNDCVGHKTPLFLNGSDDLGNFEISNIEVYWHIQIQIYLQIKDLPPGTKIDTVKWNKG